MILPYIRCNYSAAVQNEFVFFIHSIGPDAGKPSLNPCRNSFSVNCQNQEYYNFYYWLVYALHKAGKFQTQHRRYSVPFINVNNVRQVIGDIAPVVHPEWEQFASLVKYFDEVNKVKTSMEEQVLSSERLQKYLLNFS